MGNCSQKEKKQTNEQLQAQHRERETKRSVNIVLLGEDDAGKDTVCLQLIKQSKSDSKMPSTSPVSSTLESEVKKENSAGASDSQESKDKDSHHSALTTSPSEEPHLHQMIVNNPHIVLAALNSGTTVENMPEDQKNLHFNLITFPGKEEQRKKFWNEDTFRKIVQAHEDEIVYADGLIFVVDASQKDRVERASRVIHETLHQRHLEKCPMVIFANKQDLPNAMKPNEVESHLKLIRVPNGRLWCTIGSQALRSGKELNEGLVWLLENKPGSR